MTGNVEVGVVDASLPAQLGFADDGPPPDGLVQAEADVLAAALDDFLDAAQQGAPDLARIGAEWLPDVDPAGAEVLASGLATPANPVARATYNMTVQVEPAPTVITTLVSVARRDGSLQQLEMAFDVTGDAPLLQLVGEAEIG